MDARQFLAEFGHIANANGGVQRLRTLITQLAVQGKLIGNGLSDSHTNELLEKISKIKISFITDKKLPREKPFPKVNDQELPVERPANWLFPRFGEVWLLVSGRDLAKSQYNDRSRGMPYITGASNIKNGIISINRWTESPVVISHKNDLLITCKGTIGSIALNTIGEIHIARQIMAVRNFSKLLNESFLKIWLENYVIKLVEKSKSMIPGFSREDLMYAIFPLPPLEEQARIVAKVDELMALCDQLEEQQQQKRQLQNQLRQATLQAIAAATNPFELKQHWQRLQDNFEQLFSAPEDVKELKQLVMSLAIRGLLVSQDESSEKYVDETIQKILLKKTSYIDENKIKRPKPTYEVQAEEEPFTLPKGWKCVRFSDVTICLDGKRAPLSKTQRQHRAGGYPYYGASGIIDSIDDYIFDQDLLLIGEDGANLINRSTPIAFIASGKYWVNNHAHVLDSLNVQILRYIELYINTIDLKPYVTGTAQPKMNQAKMNAIVVALPPLTEQKKILKQVSELMNTCDYLETKLKASNTVSKQLATASIAALTGINTPQEEEPLKVPQTELVAPVTLGTEKPNSKDVAPLAELLTRHNGSMNANDLWQRFGGEIDAFYAQLKTEVAHDWLTEPAAAEMLEKEVS